MLGAVDLAAQGQSGAGVPKRPLGRTGLEVSVLGIGGYHLGSVDTDAEATQIVNEALDAGVNLQCRASTNTFRYEIANANANAGCGMEMEPEVQSVAPA